MSVYAAFARSAFQTQLAYRNEVWANMFGKLVQVYARVAIWLAIYAGATVVNGVTLPQMVTYALLGGAVLGATRYERVINDIGDSLKSGDIAIWLLKPLHYPLYLFANEFGTTAFRFLILVVPTIAVVALTYGMLPPASFFYGAMFVAYWVLSFLIIFLIATLFGLVAFWLMTAFSLEWLLQGLLSVLSGSLVPFWFFPEPLGSIAAHLPFAWIVYYPTAVWLGKLPPEGCVLYFGIGTLWAALLALGVWLLWRRASTRITVQGG